ncbi:MAG: hypothetical protein DA405_05635 [Bacteroidetes bacterium]|nr:MAG: hypothetical protein DA405_05635 [Bacteroidota bacterium]
MRKLLLFLTLSCAWLFSVGQGTLTTFPPLTANNGQSGVTFQVSSTSPANITAIGCVVNAGVTSADVWIRVGGVSSAGAPNITVAGGWTQVVTAGTVTGATGTSIAPIAIATPIAIPANTPVGVYIGAGLRYQSGTAADVVTYTDGTFTVDVSNGVSYGGAAPNPTFNPRRFLGSVTYALAVTGNCTPFTGFLIDSISSSASKLSWTPGASNSSFKVEYGVAGFTPGTGTTVTGTYPGSQPPVILTGLNPNTNYDVWLEEYCNTGADTVGFPAPQSFTTTKLCAAPTALTDSNLTSNSIDLGWAQAGSYNSAWILYGPAGTTPGSAGWMIDSVLSPATTFTITGLTSSTAYDIYLATNCGSVNGISDTVGPISITTPISGPQGLNCTVGSAGPLFSDDFESQGSWTGDWGTGTTASNWNYRSGGTGSSGTGPSGAHSGSQYIYVETSGTPSGANVEAISPRIDLSTSFNSAELSFWLHAYGAGIDTVKVQVGSTASGPWSTVFTNVGQIQTNNTDPWQNVGVNLDAYVGTAIHLRFVYVHGSGFTGDVGIDLVEVNSCQTCPNSGNPNLVFVSSDSASFTWSGSGTSYDINWGPAGFSQGSGSTSFDSTSVNGISIGGLMGNTSYDIYVRNNCSDSANGFGGWVGPLTFTTLCNPFTAPYSNNFDADILDQAPNCWDNFLSGANTQFSDAYVFTPSATYPPISSPNVVQLYNYNNDTTWLITPQFSDLSSGANRISFHAMTTTTATGNDLIIGTIASPSDRASFTAIDTVTVTRNYAQFVVDITTANGYNGTHEFIVFRHAASASFRTYYIDDFVYEAIPSCNPPLISTLGVNYTTSTDAEVFWGSGSDGDTTFIEYGPLGFTPGVNALGTISVTGSMDTALITGLTSETDYEFYIQDSCFGNGTSPYVGPVAFKTACAISSAAILPLVDGFENYTSGPTFTGANAYFCNPSYNWTFVPAGNGRARLQANALYYNSGAQAFTMDQSSFPSQVETNSLIMTVNLSNYTTAGGIELGFVIMDHSATVRPDDKVYVRGSASDPWIQILDLITAVSGTGFHDSITNIDIMAPITAAGQTVGAATQIMFTQSGQSQAITATCCEGYSLDDVSLTAVSCPNPTGLNTSALVDTSVTMAWANSASAGQYQYWFGPAGFYQGTTTVGGVKQYTTASSVTIDTLRPTTCYQFLVRGVCAPGDTSGWVGPFDFCTTCPVNFSMPYFTDFEITAPGIAQGSPAGWANCWTTSAPGGTLRWESEDASGANENSLNTGPFLDNTLAPNTGGKYMYLETSTSGTYADLVSPGINLNGAVNPQVEFAYHMFGATINKLVLLAENVTTGAVTTLDSIVGQQQTAGSDPFNTHVTNVSSLASGSYRFIFRGYIGTSFTGDISIDDVFVMEAPTCPRPAGLMMDSASLTSITASWTSNGTGSSWALEYGPSGFTPGSGTSVVATSNPYTITGLTAATAYDVYVAEICGAGDTSISVGPVLMNTTLCNPSSLCWYQIDLEDSFGDGWNGALLDVVQNGVVVATLGQSFTTGNLYQDSVQVCDGLSTAFVLSAAGGWPSEVGITVTTPYGTQAGQYTNSPATAQGDTLVNVVIQCTAPTCPQPTGIAVASVTGTTASISWTSMGTGTAWEIEYGTGTFLPGAGTTVSAPTNPFTLTGLNGSTNYNVYVREICGAGDTSVWAGPINFATACVTVNAPYFTDFENIPIGVATGTPLSWNNCWTASTGTFLWESEDATGANENSLNTGPFFDNTTPSTAGGTYMYIETSSTGTAAELVSPAVDFSGLTNPELKYHYHMYGATINKLVVYAQDASGIRTAIDSIIGQQQTAGSDSFRVATVDLSTLSSTTYSFVFEGHRGTSFTGDISLDDISVAEAGATTSPCNAPTMLVATANVGCDSVEVNWMSNTGGSILEYGPAGFAPGTGSMTGIVTAPYTITGLAPGTAYDVWVADTCTGDTSAYASLLNTSTATAPVPVASISSFTDTIINGQYILTVDASGSNNATAYSWDFGNGVTGSGVADTVVYLGNGVYTVILTATNACGTSTDTITVNVNIGLEDNPLANSLNVYPNPAQYSVNVSFREVGSADVQITLRDAQGRNVINMNDRMQSGTYSNDIDVSGLARGIYMLEIKSGSLTAHRRVSIK